MAKPDPGASTAPLLEALNEALQTLGPRASAAPICVGYSGGRDSHVLLHVLATFRVALPPVSLRALHVDHGLQPDSAAWAEHCRAVCKALEVPLTIARVSADGGNGDGPEGDARRMRFDAFSGALAVDESLLLAHHAEDQAETFLLQALRGAGPDGLAAMPVRRRLGRGWLMRPWLACRQATLDAYAREAGLRWIDDPSNEDRAFDRNFLRHEILPRLAARWPAAVTTLGRAAGRSAAASTTLSSVAREDLSRVHVRHDDTLAIAALATLPRERGYQAVRLWLRDRRRRMPRLADLDAVWHKLVLAPGTDGGCVTTPEHEFRRHAGRLHVLDGPPSREDYHLRWEPPFAPLHLPTLDLWLTREAANRQGLVLNPQVGFEVRARRGGERIALAADEDDADRSVGEIMREVGLPPWRRDTQPLLMHDGVVVAIWELAVAADWRATGTDESPPSG